MQSFEQALTSFQAYFNRKHFPATPATLYEPNEYFLGLGGKRIRPVLCLMANELFDEVRPEAYAVATAIELFHNFSLIHDDIMDKAPLRRGKQTVHERNGLSTAILSGDVMLVKAYEYLGQIGTAHLPAILQLFNKTAIEVCEGQQLDMDFEKESSVKYDEYIHMITLKTSVLVAASLQMGAILGGAGEGNQHHLYAFGRDLGISFQIQDDYLDAYGDPGKFGKQVGGDILENKKTFLLIRALETASGATLAELNSLLSSNPADKVSRMLKVYDECGVSAWTNELKMTYYEKALQHLEAVAVVSSRKKPLMDLADQLIQREY